MAVLKSCFCFSLRQGSFIIGSYALIVYCVAFAVELWWIVESLLILPAPAYTLCALYFFNFIMAAVLLFGLLVRQRKYLMSWTLMTVLSFFPEAGMVLFMSIYYWPGQRYEYGVIELAYWSIRAMFNIFGAVAVCSLYLTWRDEELILGRLHDLTLANVELESQSVGSVFLGGTVPRLSVLGRQSTLLRGGGGHISVLGGDAAFNKATLNPPPGGTLSSKSTSSKSRNLVAVGVAIGVELVPPCKASVVGGGCRLMNMEIELDYKNDLSVDNTGPSIPNTDSVARDDNSRFVAVVSEWCRYFCICFFRRKSSFPKSLSLLSLSDFGGGLGDGQDKGLIRNGLICSRSHLNLDPGHNHNSNTALRASLLRMKSEFHPASIFNPASRKHRISELGIAGIGLEPPGQLPWHPNIQRSRSLWNISNEDYWSRPPPSRPVSLGYVNYAHQLDQELGTFGYPHPPQYQNEMDYDHYTLRNNMLNANMRSQSVTQLARPNLNPLTHLNNNNKYAGSSLLMTRPTGGGGWEEMRLSGRRRAQSMDALNINAMNGGHGSSGASIFQQRYYGQNILAHAHNHTHSRNEYRGDHSNIRRWSKSSLESEEEEEDDDDIRSYQDIPL